MFIKKISTSKKYYIGAILSCILTYILALFLSKNTSLGGMDSCLFLLGSILLISGATGSMSSYTQQKDFIRMMKDEKLQNTTYSNTLPVIDNANGKEEVYFDLSVTTLSFICNGLLFLIISFVI